MKVSFGIINYNRLFYLKSCAESLMESVKGYDNVEFISSIPSSESKLKDNIFEKQKKGDKISRFIAQFFAIFSPLGNEGGLFLFIGKKK